MRKKFSKEKIVTLLVVSIMAGNVVVSAQPGDDKDPIVSKSYVDAQIDKLKAYVDDKLASNNSNENSGQTSNSEYKIVKVKAGEKIILSASSEIILRGGKANIIDSEAGGIADLTSGNDLREGYEVPSNHLLLVPLSDGRGVCAGEDSIFMIKGDYEIKK